MKRITLIILLLPFFLQTFSFNKENVTFQKLPFKQMLPGSSVKRVFQDHKGFIWLGTESGICRYDGYNLLVIKSDIEHPNLLTSGNILCIEQDKQKRIWFGTDRGVNVLDENNRIIDVIKDTVIQNLRINSIVCDTKGCVWIGSENGLFMYTDENAPIKRFYHRANGSSIPGNNVNSILEDKNGTIWIALWQDGLCRYNRQSQQFVKIPALGDENNPFALFQDSKGIIWAGTGSEGLFRLNIDKNNNVVDYRQILLPQLNILSTRNFVYSITEDIATNELWILSHAGISVISEENNYAIQSISALDLFENASNFLNYLFRDKQGNIWIATLNDGVYIANLHKQMIKTNPLTSLKQKSGFIDVNAMIENGNEIWLGLRNFGIYLVDKRNSETITGLMLVEHPIMLKQVRCFCHDRNKHFIWIGGNNLLENTIPD